MPSTRTATASRLFINWLARSSSSATRLASASLPVTAAISPPWLLLIRSVKLRTSVRVCDRADSAAVRRLTFCSTSRASATILGISAETSPRSTMRSLSGGSGGSSRMPVKARSRAAPTRPRSSVNTLEMRSQCASFTGTSTRMRTVPCSASSMRLTRPMGKPEKVMSMPTTTPSESSAVRYSFCVASKAPRTHIRYSTEMAMSSAMKISSSAARASSRRWARRVAGGTGSSLPGSGAAAGSGRPGDGLWGAGGGGLPCGSVIAVNSNCR